MSIKIYSWNICFGCMEPSIAHLDKTSQTLARECEKKNNCIENVIKQLSKYKYDFIGLQEATNWNIIYTELIKIYPSYRFTQHRSGPEDMITIYDTDRFKLDNIRCNEFEPGRPFQILYLTERITLEKFIVINLHAPHYHSSGMGKLIHYMSNSLIDAYINMRDNNNLPDIEKLRLSDISKYINDNAQKFNVIIFGDFNDEGEKYWNGLKPFNKSDLVNKNITVTSINEPPKTCCVGSSRIRTAMGQDMRFGDYILIDTTKMDYIYNNTIPSDPSFYTKEFITSDHLPVYSEIILKQSQSASASASASASTSANVIKLKPTVTSKILRLMVSNYDPLQYPIISNSQFKGGQIKNNNNIIYPNGRINTVQNKMGQPVNYVLVVLKSNPDIIGYINFDYLINVGGAIKLDFKYKQRTLRLRITNDDPNDPAHTAIKGGIVTSKNELIFPKGETYTAADNDKINTYVLIQKEDDGNIFGYINIDYLSIPGGASAFNKYLKYKQKYLELKKQMCHV